MASVKWNMPVEVASDSEKIRIVTGPSDALNCLSEIWPAQRGPLYVAARSVCRAAIDGRKSVEEARDRFLSAAQEAELSVH